MTGKKITEEQKQEIISLMRSRGAVVGYLFGSYARGTAGPLSDIDVGVIFPPTLTKDAQDERIEEIRNGLEKKFGGRDKADVVNISLARSPLLRYIVTVRQGEVLFSDNIGLQNQAIYKALRDYEDTRTIRAIQSRAVRAYFS